MLSDILRTQPNVELVEARSLAEANASIDASIPDLILLDIKLSSDPDDRGGFEVLRRMGKTQPTARARRVPPDVMRAAIRKLAQLDAATRLDDLRVPPANRLESLAGKLRGHHSIRVNDQWRIVFRWQDDGPHDVAFTDYH
jgi:proteic killer suppression protein